MILWWGSGDCRVCVSHTQYKLTYDSNTFLYNLYKMDGFDWFCEILKYNCYALLQFHRLYDVELVQKKETKKIENETNWTRSWRSRRDETIVPIGWNASFCSDSGCSMNGWCGVWRCWTWTGQRWICWCMHWCHCAHLQRMRREKKSKNFRMGAFCVTMFLLTHAQLSQIFQFGETGQFDEERIYDQPTPYASDQR